MSRHGRRKLQMGHFSAPGGGGCRGLLCEPFTEPRKKATISSACLRVVHAVYTKKRLGSAVLLLAKGGLANADSRVRRLLLRMSADNWQGKRGRKSLTRSHDKKSDDLIRTIKDSSILPWRIYIEPTTGHETFSFHYHERACSWPPLTSTGIIDPLSSNNIRNLPIAPPHQASHLSTFFHTLLTATAVLLFISGLTPHCRHTKLEHKYSASVIASPTLCFRIQSHSYPPYSRHPTMDRFLGPHTPEAMAHHQLTENWFNWDMDHPSLNETLIAGCASYQAFNRYLSGHDLYILPRSRRELVKILQRYAHDAIHNAIAKARSTLEEGGYSRICHLADESIGKVLDQNDNTSYLLELHRPQRDHMSNNLTASPSRHITIK